MINSKCHGELAESRHVILNDKKISNRQLVIGKEKKQMLVIWRAWDRQKCGPALAVSVEALFCLDFLFLFHLRKKKKKVGCLNSKKNLIKTMCGNICGQSVLDSARIDCGFVREQNPSYQGMAG
jgi:hypothetical protein